MKYIEIPALSRLAQALTHEGPECAVHTRLEAYSCKNVKRDKKLFKTLETAYKDDAAHSPPALSPGSSSESSGSSSPDVGNHVPQWVGAHPSSPPDALGWPHEYQSQGNFVDEKMFGMNTYYDVPNAPAPTMQYNVDANANPIRVNSNGRNVFGY